MFKLLGCLILFIILIPLLLVGGVFLKFWNILTGNNNNENNFGGFTNSGQNTRSNNTTSGQSSNRRSSANSGYSQHADGQKKIFKESEGEYVDFEEVD